MKLYSITKKVWRASLPTGVSKTLLSQHNAFGRMMLRCKAKLEQRAGHDELYDAHYFERQDTNMKHSAGVIASSLIERFSPTSVIDVGCGSGAILQALRDAGVEVRGLEYADAAIEICRAKGLPVDKFDLESDSPFLEDADLALSTEVAEHLPEHCADAYVRLLCQISRTAVAMTAAVPGQGGTDHVNEQPNEYWIEKFAAHDYRHDPDLTSRLRVEWLSAQVESHRARNVMVFWCPRP